MTVLLIKGYFALVNAEQDHAEGMTAMLLNQLFVKNDKMFCIHFWFSVSGPNSGSLAVLAGIELQNDYTTIWEVITDDGTGLSNEWTEGQTEYLVCSNS